MTKTDSVLTQKNRILSEFERHQNKGSELEQELKKIAEQEDRILTDLESLVNIHKRTRARIAIGHARHQKIESESVSAHEEAENPWDSQLSLSTLLHRHNAVSMRNRLKAQFEQWLSERQTEEQTAFQAVRDFLKTSGAEEIASAHQGNSYESEFRRSLPNSISEYLK